MDANDARDLALALPQAQERDHHGFPSFRTRRIFATLPQPSVLRVMLDEGGIREAVAEWPWCSEVWWGATLSAVAVDLEAAHREVVAELLADAHARASAVRR